MFTLQVKRTWYHTIQIKNVQKVHDKMETGLLFTELQCASQKQNNI